MTQTIKTTYLAAPLIALLMLTACNENETQQSETTETVLGDIDVLEGSTSDEMITVDEFDEAQNPNPADPGSDGAAPPQSSTPEVAPPAANEGDEVVRPRAAPPPPRPVAPQAPNDADTGV